MFPIASNTDDPGITYVDDVFSAYLYTGAGGTQTINNGIDLAGKGGLVWRKARNQAWQAVLIDTVRGGDSYLVSDSTGAAAPGSNNNEKIAFTNTGIVSDASGGTNWSTNTVAFSTWTFRKAAKFFDIVTYTGNGSAGQTIAHSLGVAPGMIIIKRTDAAEDWFVWHRGDGAASVTGIPLNLTNAAGWNSSGYNITSTTTIPLGNINKKTGDGSNPVTLNGTYVAYVFAHNTAADSMIKCGSFTTDASGTATVDLGWEPQFLISKSATGTSNWWISDIMRGMTVDKSTAYLSVNTSNAEATGTLYGVTNTGFNAAAQNASQTYIYMAIRRPNKPPTSGAQVYNAIARAGTGAAATVSGVGFAPDFSVIMERNRGAINVFLDRLRGATKFINSINTAAELTIPDNIFFNQNGITVGADTGGYGNNQASITYINHFFKRAPGFMDVVCYTGTGAVTTVKHSLGVLPEFLIVKSRATGGINYEWLVHHKAFPSGVGLLLNSSAGSDAGWQGGLNGGLDGTGATNATQIGISQYTRYNGSGNTYVMYMWATLAGVSKVGSYTGNGSSQTINCGFAAGARFILIKRHDAAGDWYVWDTTRGIVTGNDPHLSLNTTAAEVTTDDSIDPGSTGFIVNQVAATNINVTSATYIFLAIS